jgi:HD-GYP domain-containing protein (c-di-GMP phosphodiesterase class II)
VATVAGVALSYRGWRRGLSARRSRDRIRSLVRHHHEQLDGTGYPDGATTLSLETRVLAVCDVYDARRSDRVYREAWVHARAIALLRDEADTKFDARCVEALSRVLDCQSASRTLVAV